MASRSIDLISKKTNCTCSVRAFCLSLPLFCTTTTLFCRTKTSNFLVTHYFYGEMVIMCLPNTLSPVRVHACLLLFFTVGHFHLAGC